MQLGDVARELLFLAARAGQFAAQRLDLLLQVEHAAAHLGVLVHQAVLRRHGLIEALAQIQDGLARLVVTEKLRVRALPGQTGHGQHGGAEIRRRHAAHAQR